ncbi:bifunctional acetate--CoA ligase family protein/GNAT family N-acetyltransferase [Undibacterium sp.]|jgi:acetyltransferase|uniref:bifunctional acetate--CoA ligase family protein/GNAT family N-acetyltransferase n=1 Tax=Undibacterium sp. TaxID=1914977 RepID=UPI002B61172C|nr:bifunctional acetate--CoA ligase family protein/GNAT family N-acetyltransferase [Undibacterium sp.]HTD04723.1 bifunctional acetate--CoA ligase family protein/GNAT family N-acetyltransferase [Undibacterium sp.]
MTIRNLEYLFAPKSVAVIGASNKLHSIGATVLNNLVEAGFQGTIFPVNPKYDSLNGLKTYAGVQHLPVAPDLAVICTPPASIPALIAELGARGTRAAIVLTAGLNLHLDGGAASVRQLMLDAAKPTLLRILGPNCVGLLVPGIGLNASFAHTGALPGKIAFVSQSGALVTGVLEWAKLRGIGFSKFISLGDNADIDFADVLDYLAGDADTRAILMYVEDIKHARKFMSAARAAARSKPVLVVKAGRAAEGSKAAASHTGALAGSDAVYDAAIRRAGMLRVFATEDLFGAVETLAYAKPMSGERLTILTNGGGPGVMATDALIFSDGKLAAIPSDTAAQLDAVLPATWSHGNPVDIIGDAPAERYVKALEILLKNPQSDAILFIQAPTAIVPSIDIANAIAPLAQSMSRNVLACWLGSDAKAPARQVFSAAGIPAYDTPEEAVRGFMQIVQYHRNQHLLMQVPPSLSADFVPDRAAAQAVATAALAAGRSMLSEPEAKIMLAAYGIPVVETRIADTAEQAVQYAQEIGFPVAVKVLSPEISHKTEVGGVVLDLETAQAVQAATQAIRERLRELRPEATLRGFSVQAMARRPDAQELIVGVTTDAVFGPVILFGQGGIAVEVIDDNTIGLPPLNMVLARDMISRTRVAKLLAGYRDRPAADVDAICRTLIQISQLVSDIPEIAELDINPLLADAGGVLALDARIRVAAADTAAGVDRLAIRPYPAELEQWITWQGRPLLLRPIRPEDGGAHVAFFNALDPEDVRLRMFIRMRELQPDQLARFTQIDYDRDMAFIATRRRADGEYETLGVVRAMADPGNEKAEFAVTVRSDVKSCGLGSILMAKLVDYCRHRGTPEIVGEALPQNIGVLNLVKRFGFEVKAMPEEGVMMLRLDLRHAK